MSTNQFYDNLRNVGQKIMNNKNLQVNGREYEILSLSIHCRNDYVDDAFVTPRNALNKFGWFISPREYSRYLDIDLTSEKMEGGFRIDAIKSVSSGETILSCGRVYDLIKQSLGETTFKNLTGKNVLHYEKLSLIDRVENGDKFYHLPRLSGFHFNVPPCSLPNMYERFLPLKIVKSINVSSILDVSKCIDLKKETLPILLDLYVNYGRNEIPDYLNVKRNIWLKYVDLYEASKYKSQWDILEKYQDCKKSNQSLIAELAGHFSVN